MEILQEKVTRNGQLLTEMNEIIRKYKGEGPENYDEQDKITILNNFRERKTLNAEIEELQYKD